jgi:hypothetical protein
VRFPERAPTESLFCVAESRFEDKSLESEPPLTFVETSDVKSMFYTITAAMREIAPALDNIMAERIFILCVRCIRANSMLDVMLILADVKHLVTGRSCVGAIMAAFQGGWRFTPLPPSPSPSADLSVESVSSKPEFGVNADGQEYVALSAGEEPLPDMDSNWRSFWEAANPVVQSKAGRSMWHFANVMGLTPHEAVDLRGMMPGEYLGERAMRLTVKDFNGVIFDLVAGVLSTARSWFFGESIVYKDPVNDAINACEVMATKQFLHRARPGDTLPDRATIQAARDTLKAADKVFLPLTKFDASSREGALCRMLSVSKGKLAAAISRFEIAQMQRVRPLGIMITGPAGVGKTLVREILSAGFMANAGDTDMSGVSVVASVMSKFHEHLANDVRQVWFDDVDNVNGKRKAAEESLVALGAQLVQLLSTAAFVAIMADLRDKGTVRVAPHVVGVVTNTPLIIMDLTSTKEAMGRRLIHLEVALKPEWANAQGCLNYKAATGYLRDCGADFLFGEAGPWEMTLSEYVIRPAVSESGWQIVRTGAAACIADVFQRHQAFLAQDVDRVNTTCLAQGCCGAPWPTHKADCEGYRAVTVGVAEQQLDRLDWSFVRDFAPGLTMEAIRARFYRPKTPRDGAVMVKMAAWLWAYCFFTVFAAVERHCWQFAAGAAATAVALSACGFHGPAMFFVVLVGLTLAYDARRGEVFEVARRVAQVELEPRRTPAEFAEHLWDRLMHPGEVRKRQLACACLAVAVTALVTYLAMRPRDKVYGATTHRDTEPVPGVPPLVAVAPRDPPPPTMWVVPNKEKAVDGPMKTMHAFDLRALVERCMVKVRAPGVVAGKRFIATNGVVVGPTVVFARHYLAQDSTIALVDVVGSVTQLRSRQLVADVASRRSLVGRDLVSLGGLSGQIPRHSLVQFMPKRQLQVGEVFGVGDVYLCRNGGQSEWVRVTQVCVVPNPNYPGLPADATLPVVRVCFPVGCGLDNGVCGSVLVVTFNGVQLVVGMLVGAAPDVSCAVFAQVWQSDYAGVVTAGVVSPRDVVGPIAPRSALQLLDPAMQVVSLGTYGPATLRHTSAIEFYASESSRLATELALLEGVVYAKPIMDTAEEWEDGVPITCYGAFVRKFPLGEPDARAFLIHCAAHDYVVGRLAEGPPLHNGGSISWGEAAVGFLAAEGAYLPPLDLTTNSSGKYPGPKGNWIKRDPLDPTVVRFDFRLLADMNEAWDCLVSGVGELVFEDFKGTPKDEMRALKDGKRRPARLIWVGSLVLLMVMRRAMGAVVAHATTHGRSCGYMPGIDPASAEWGEMAARLASASQDGMVIEGDLAANDQSQQGALAQKRDMLAHDVAFRKGADPLVTGALRNLAWSLRNVRFDLRNDAMMTDMNASGRMDTTFVNTGDTMTLTVGAAIDQGVPLTLIEQADFGDDLGVAGPLDVQAMVRHFKLLCMTLTPARSKGGQPGRCKIYGEFSFLKRQFIKFEDGIVRAPLALSSVAKPFIGHIPSDAATWQTQLMGASRGAMRELWMHGEEAFNRHRPMVDAAWQESGGEMLYGRLPSYFVTDVEMSRRYW